MPEETWRTRGAGQRSRRRKTTARRARRSQGGAVRVPAPTGREGEGARWRGGRRRVAVAVAGTPAARAGGLGVGPGPLERSSLSLLQVESMRNREGSPTLTSAPLCASVCASSSGTGRSSTVEVRSVRRAGAFSPRRLAAAGTSRCIPFVPHASARCSLHADRAIALNGDAAVSCYAATKPCEHRVTLS